MLGNAQIQVTTAAMELKEAEGGGKKEKGILTETKRSGSLGKK